MTLRNGVPTSQSSHAAGRDRGPGGTSGRWRLLGAELGVVSVFTQMVQGRWHLLLEVRAGGFGVFRRFHTEQQEREEDAERDQGRYARWVERGQSQRGNGSRESSPGEEAG